MKRSSSGWDLRSCVCPRAPRWRRTFRLITEDVGGRLRSSADGSVNMGAYYVTRDYFHVNQWVDRGRRIRRRQIQRGAADGSFRRGDLPLLAHLPQAVRFVRLVRDFRRRHDALRLECLEMSQAEPIRADPILWDLYREPALEFVRRHRIEDIARLYIAPLAQATAFTSLERITAITLLIGSLPTAVPIYEFSFRPDDLISGFEESIVFDSVTEVSREGSHYSIGTSSGETYRATNVVVATPVEVAARLLDLGEVKGPVFAHMFLIEGDLRQPWARSIFTLFPEGAETLAIARQGGAICLARRARALTSLSTSAHGRLSSITTGIRLFRLNLNPRGAAWIRYPYAAATYQKPLRHTMNPDALSVGGLPMGLHGSYACKLSA